MTYWFSSDYHLGHANIIRYCNRPFNSLREIYLGLNLNTNTTHEQLLEVIDNHLIKVNPIIKANPILSFKILISLLPNPQVPITKPISRPKYRDWIKNGVKKATKDEYFEYIKEISDRITNLVNGKPEELLISFIPNLDRLHKDTVNKAIDKLSSMDKSQLTSEKLLEILDTLRNFISDQRKYSKKLLLEGGQNLEPDKRNH